MRPDSISEVSKRDLEILSGVALTSLSIRLCDR